MWVDINFTINFFNFIDVSLIRGLCLHKNCYRELTATCSKHLLKCLTSWRVKLDRTEFSIRYSRSPCLWLRLNRCCHYSYHTSNILRRKLINIALNLGYLIEAFILDAWPLATHGQWIVFNVSCLSKQNASLIQWFSLCSEIEFIIVIAPSSQCALARLRLFAIVSASWSLKMTLIWRVTLAIIIVIRVHFKL